MAKKLNWLTIEKKLKESKVLIFTPKDLRYLLNASELSVRFFINRYLKKGAILRLRKGLYTLSDREPPVYLIANKIYEPSYISFETALSYHHIIPETIYTVTSATTRATREFEARGLLFTYHKIKRKLFTGYSPQKISGQTVLIALPEKALVDYLYFVSLGRSSLNERIDTSGLRKKQTLHYAKSFNRKRLVDLAKSIL